MPKIIENVRGLIIDEAKRQIAENGYDAVTIRSIAKGCSIGLGTFYNYFKSKDMLIAAFLLDDWKERMDRVAHESEGENDPMAVVHRVCDELNEFMYNYSSIFASKEAKKSFNSSVSEYHKVLRMQISEPICKSCLAGGYPNAEFLSEFTAEATLTWTVARKDFDELAAVLSKLFVK